MHMADQYYGLSRPIKHSWGERIFAGLLTCALHVSVACLMWLSEPTHSVYVATADEPMFVEILSTPSVPEPHTMAAQPCIARWG